MKCNEAELLIMEYFDGGLMKEKLDLLVAHFSECEACKLEFESMKSVLEAVESLPELEPDENFTQSVMKKVEKKGWQLRTERYFSGFLWAAALLAFMILTRDFLQDSVTGIASSNAVSSVVGSANFGLGSSWTASISSFFADIPARLSHLLERTMYFRTILLSEYLTIVLGLAFTFVVANLGLGRMFLGKNPDRRAV